jgi:L-lactate utilization protein LutC
MNEILEKIKKYSTSIDGFTPFGISKPEEKNKSDLDPVKLFEFELNRAGGNFVNSDSPKDLIQKIGDIINKVGGNKIILGRKIDPAFLTDLKNANPKLSFNTLESNLNSDELKITISSSDVSISFADYLIAETGTIVVISKNEEARTLSILTPINIIIADKNKILPDLDSLLSTLTKDFGEKIPHSAVIFITGPSRTADIEKILIIGVHGPRELFVILK